jgi:hypothetical protein
MTNTGQTVTENKKYKIVFSGDIQPGHDLISVKARLANSFGVSGAVIDKLFPGKAVLIKGDLTYDNAQLFKMKLEQNGAVFQLLEASEKPRQPEPKPEPPPPPQPTMTMIPDSPTTSPSGPTAREFSFRPVQKKSNTSRNIAIVVAVLILLGILSNIGRKNRTGVIVPQHHNKSTDIFGGIHTRFFNDPKHYYSVTLPSNYTLSDKSYGQRSKITFNFPGDNSISILASPMNREWRPQEEMIRKIQGINSGKAGPISSFTVERYQIIEFNGMYGYELFLRKGSRIAHSYSVVSFSNTAIAIAIVTSGSDAQANHDVLNNAIKTSFRPN